MSNPRTQQDWQAMAGTLSIRTQAFIDGKYVDAASGKTFDCVSPIDGRVLGQVADGQEEDINRAVAAARRSFDAGAWSNARPTHRKKVLLKLTQLIEQHADELALLESLDMGKPVSDARSVDLAATIRCMGWTAEALDKLAKFKAKIGYPGKWRDYSALELVPDDLIGTLSSVFFATSTSPESARRTTPATSRAWNRRTCTFRKPCCSPWFTPLSCLRRSGCAYPKDTCAAEFRG